VPGESGYREFVHVEYDHLGNSVAFSGFAIEVFKETIKRLPFTLPYEFIAFKNTSYDELVKQIHLKVRHKRTTFCPLTFSFDFLTIKH
jgi:ionotropic glutamate receptor